MGKMQQLSVASNLFVGFSVNFVVFLRGLQQLFKLVIVLIQLLFMWI